MAPTPPSVARARRLRRAGTDAEKTLWRRLRAHQIFGAKFRRQERVGPFIVDFCCLDPKLVVEVDGGQHAERMDADAKRTAYLERCGYRVVRFWNGDVLRETDAVVARIAEEVERARGK